MQLFLVRHATAFDAAPGEPDAARALTPEGRARFAAEVEGLRRLGLGFDVVLHSPWRRAVETAALLAPLAASAPRVEAWLAAPPSEALLAVVEAAPKGARVALVGHEPWLSALTAWLVVGEASRGESFELDKGAVVVLVGRPRAGHMRLSALLPPEVLAIAR